MKKEVDQDQREKFKDITGCKEFLNVETQAAEEIVENLTQTHMEKTMTLEDQANCEYDGDPCGQQAAIEKITVLVVESMKAPYVKRIDSGLHALQEEVGGDIAAYYPFDDPVGLVMNDKGKLIGLDLNRSLRDDRGVIYDIVAGTFLVVGLGTERFISLLPAMIQKYTEQFRWPELFISINGRIVSVPVKLE